MDTSIADPAREPWNEGKLVGQRTPFKLQEIWSIRIRLQVANRSHLHIMAARPWTLRTHDIPSSIATFVTFGSATQFRGAVISFSWWLSLGSSCNSPDPAPSLAES
jgi:hypothetical protein